MIGDLIDNLNEVLVHVGDRDQQLGRLIISFRDLMGGLKDDRRGDPVARSTRCPRCPWRPPAWCPASASRSSGTSRELREFAGNLDANKAELDRALQVLPIKLEKVGRTAIYGSWFNFYLCEFQGRVKLPAGVEVPVTYETGSTVRMNLTPRLLAGLARAGDLE